MLPRRTSVATRRSLRWRSPAHTKWVSGFACCMCGSATNVVAAHVRIGSDAGMGRKPSDWFTAPLCDGPRANNLQQLGCHNVQHAIGEETFWLRYEGQHGQTIGQLLDELAKASPKAREIAAVKAERADG